MEGSLSAAQEALRRAKARLHISGSSTAQSPRYPEPRSPSTSTLSCSQGTALQHAVRSLQATSPYSTGCAPAVPARYDTEATASERCGSAQSSGSTYGATASRGPSGSADGITQSTAPVPAAMQSVSPTPSPRASPSSELPEEQPTLLAGPGLAEGQIKLKMPAWRVPTPALCTSSIPQDTDSPPRASAPTHNSTPDPAITWPASASPDAYPPRPATSPVRAESAQGRQSQHGPPSQAHVRFSVPATDSKSGRGPSTVPTAPPPSVSAADQAAMALLQRLSYAEVQLAQLYVARGTAAALMAADATSKSAESRLGLEDGVDLSMGEDGDNEEEGEGGAWWDEVPSTLDVTVALRSSRRLRAALADEGAAVMLNERGDQPTQVYGAERTVAAGAGAVGASGCEVNREGNGTVRHAQDLPAPVPSRMAATSNSTSACADVQWTAHDDDDDTEEQDALSLSPITCASPNTPPPGTSILLSASPARRTPGQLPVSWSPSPSIGRSRIATAAQRWTLANFDVGRRIGQGHSGRVFMAREKQSKVVVALKAMAEDGACGQERGPACMERALRLQATAGRHCPFIVRLYTSFSDKWRWYAVLEYAAAGDLAAHLAAQPHRRLSEAQARPLVRHITCALAHVHQQGIVHRAVTARNVLLRRAEDSGDGDGDGGLLAKLGDFASAVQLPDGDCARWAGRLDEAADGRGGGRLLDYTAPEVICGRGWSRKSDLWALGVLAFEMLCGYAPFDDVSPAGVKRLVCAGKACFPPHGLSHTATSFLRALLRVEEPARCDAAAALAHPFLAATAASAAAHGATLWDGVPPPVSRDLSEMFSQVAASGRSEKDRDVNAAQADEDVAHLDGSPTTTEAETAPSINTATCSGPVLGAALRSVAVATPSVQAGESVSCDTSRTTSLAPSPTSLLSASARAHVRGRERTASLVSVEPSSPFIGSASPLMAFACPMSALEESAHGTAVTTAPLASAMVGATASAEEVEPLFGHRASGSSLRSAGCASRRNTTPTLSDMSASLLSTTRAPNALSTTGTLASAHDDRGSLRRSHRSSSSAAGAEPGEGCARRVSGSDPRETSSVTVSSLTSTFLSAPRGEWPTGDAAVSVSSSTSTAFTHSAIEAAGDDADRRTAAPLSGVAEECTARPPSPLLWLPPPPTRLDPHPSAAVDDAASRSAGVAMVASRGGTKTKKEPVKTPPCAVRLSFDALSDEAEGW